jgi:hypothetical protein
MLRLEFELFMDKVYVFSMTFTGLRNCEIYNPEIEIVYIYAKRGPPWRNVFKDRSWPSVALQLLAA